VSWHPERISKALSKCEHRRLARSVKYLYCMFKMLLYFILTHYFVTKTYDVR